MSINKILIPTDFSEIAELAIEHGIYMANLLNAKIFLLHCITTPSGNFILPDNPGKHKELKIIQDSETQKIKLLADEITKHYNIETYPITLEGNLAKRIVDAVQQNEIDLIIMGTHGAQGFEEYFPGSNTDKVANNIPCPVISVHKLIKKIGFQNIVVPINNEFYSRQKINMVIELAIAYKSTVHVLGLFEADDPSEERKFELKINSVTKALRNAHVPFVKKIANGNNLAMEAMKYSEYISGDLIAVLTGHESNLDGMFPKHIINHSKIPILSIKPKETTVEDFQVMGE